MKQTSEISISWKIGDKEKVFRYSQRLGLSLNMFMKSVMIEESEKFNARRRKK